MYLGGISVPTQYMSNSWVLAFVDIGAGDFLQDVFGKLRTNHPPTHAYLYVTKRYLMNRTPERRAPPPAAPWSTACHFDAGFSNTFGSMAEFTSTFVTFPLAT